MDDVVIYTGYYPQEIESVIDELRQSPNITIKFGRFIPNTEGRFDEMLGVRLSSANQYAERISEMEISINPDEDLAAAIKKGLGENDGFCPCSLTRNEDTRCMCKDFREMEEGTCHCGLYIKTKESVNANSRRI